MKALIACSLAKNTGAYVRGNYLAKYLMKNGISVKYLSTFRRMPYDTYYLFSFPHNLIRSFFSRCDVAISLKAFPNATFPVLLKKMFGAKAVVDIDDLDYGLRPGFGKIIRVLQEPFVKYFDLVLVHNPNLYDYVRGTLKIPKEKILQIEQGVDTEIFRNQGRKESLRRAAGYGPEQKLIVYTAHVSPAAFLDEILEMFKRVSEEEKNARLIVVGNGPSLGYYEQRAKDMGIASKVDFTGYVKDISRIVEYLNMADACVVYYPETEANKYRCSMKLREYLSVGVPTVCNDFGDLARFKKFTYSFKTGNMGAFKSAMLKALKKPDGREMKGSKFVAKSMSWEAIGKKIAERIKTC